MSGMGEARLIITARDDTAKTFAAVERHAKDLGSTLKSVGAASAQLGRSATAMGDYGKVAREVDAVASAMARASKEAPGLKGPAEALSRSAAIATTRMRELETEAQRVAQATGRIDMFRSMQPGFAKARAEFAKTKSQVEDIARTIKANDAKITAMRQRHAILGAAQDRAASAALAARPTRETAKDPEAFRAAQAAAVAANAEYNRHVDGRRALAAEIDAEVAANAKLRRSYEGARGDVRQAAASLDQQKTAVMGLKREIESVVGPMSTLAGAEARLKAQAEGVASAMEHQAAASHRAAAEGRRDMELAERAAVHRAAPTRGASGGHGGHGDETLMGLAGLYVAHSFGHQAAETIENYREFDKERRYGKVVMDLSDEEQKPLVEQAIHGGATSRFNDIQWLESQRELAARGYNKDQVMAFAPVAAQIAQALDVSMPEGVKALEGAMLGFKKDVSTFEKAKENATRTADLQVKASKISGMGFEDIQAIYKYGGAPAQMAGLSEEKMLAFGAILKKLNMGGDESGTAFRALGKNLLAPTHEAQIGLSAAGVDYSKYQKMPDELYLPVFVNTVAKEYGIKLDEKAQGAIGKIFKNKSLIADAGKFLPAVQGVLSDVLGGDDAKSKNKIAGLARRYRDDSSKGVDTDRFFEDMMTAVSKNKTLANAIFGPKQGGRIYGALGDPEFFHQFVDLLKEHSQGYAQKVAKARMEGFNGEMQKLQGSILNVRSAIGRAWDDDGNGKGGLATAAVARLAEFTQAVAEAPPRVLQLGTAAAAAGTLFIGLKSIGLLRGGFGLNASALALDRAAAHLMMIGSGPGGVAGKLGAAAGGAAMTEGAAGALAIPELAAAATAVIGLIGAAAVAKLVKASVEAQEPGHGGQWAAPTPSTEGLDRQRLDDQEAEAADLRRRINIEKAQSKLPAGEESPNLLRLETDLQDKENQANLLRQRLANLYVSPDREVERGRAMMAMPRPEEFGPNVPDGWTDGPGRLLGKEPFGPAMPKGLPAPPASPSVLATPAPTTAKPPALSTEGGAIPVRVVSTSIDPRSISTGFTPAGMTRDFTLGNRTGNFSSPGMGTDRGFQPFPMHRAPAFEPTQAHAVPLGDLAGALHDIRATVEGPITAQVSGQATVNVLVTVSPTGQLINAVAEAKSTTVALSSFGSGSTGGVGLQRTSASPGTTGSVGPSRIVAGPGVGKSR